MQVKVTITRYVSDDPQPGMVELKLVDANDKAWTFIEKTAIPSCEADLGSSATYPIPGAIECVKIGETRDGTGRRVVRIDTSKPWGIESVEGVSTFDVLIEEIESE